MAKVIVQDVTVDLLDRLHDTNLDGRTRNSRYRQHQLRSLHGFLQQNRDELCRTMIEDTKSPAVEIFAEFHFAVETVRLLYNNIDFGKLLKQEYLIAKGDDDPQRRIPIGLVLVRPTSHTRLFSIVSVVAAAFAAGNAVLLELENNTRGVDAILRSKLKVFDSDSFAITTSRVTDAPLLERCFIVDQTGDLASVNSGLQHPVTRQVLAIVDRSADITAAAKAIVSSRCTFQGTSPYAVNVVLVNEWVKKELLREFEREVMALSTNSHANGSKSEHPESAQSTNKEVRASVTQETVMESHELLEYEFSGGTLGKGSKHSVRFLTVTGLIDAMALAHKLKPILVLYSFADRRTAKYLGQYIDSNVHFVNQIPWYLLVGPCAPDASAAPDIPLRYTPEMMSKPAPQIISLASTSLSPLGLVQISLTSNLTDLGERTALPLKPIKQGSGSFIPFFPHGILVGAATYLLPSLCISIYAIYRLAAFVYTRLTAK